MATSDPNSHDRADNAAPIDPAAPAASQPPTTAPTVKSLATARIVPCEPPPGLKDHPRYRILGMLETGGMGTIYLAEHHLMKRLVALKVVNEPLLAQAHFRERFHQEIEAAARLQHPNIVTAYDAELLGNTHFLVMEYVDGENLNEIVLRDGRLAIHRACDFTVQAARGLQHAFARGILHRDIKPHNLMLTPGGLVKILDFGLARYIAECLEAETQFAFGTPLPEESEDVGRADTVGLKTVPLSRRITYRGLGTPDFIAPEMAQDARRSDVRTDIYSLGCTLYFLLTGQVPFPGGTVLQKLRCHFYRAPRPLQELRPEIPGRLAETVERMMAKCPTERFQIPDEVASALTSFALARPGRVMIVEDDPETRTALTLALESHGLSVTLAGDGREALDRLHQGPLPDLILLDLMLPGVDGWSFLKQQKRHPAFAAIPVVVVSALDRNVAQAAALGAVDYLCKPVDPSEVPARITPYLRTDSSG